jgi:hypothetical protein
MRFSRLWLSVLFCVAMLAGSFQVGHTEPPDTIRGYDIIGIGQGKNPRFSPDNKKVAFLYEGWLCVRNLEINESVEKIARLFAIDYRWMDDSSIIHWNDAYGTPTELVDVGIVTLAGQHLEVMSESEITRLEHPILLHDGTIGYYQHSLSDETKSFRVIKQGLLPADSALNLFVPMIDYETHSVMYGDIWLVSRDGSKKKWLTFNKRYGFPILTPNGGKVIASKIPGKDPYLGGGPYVIDLDGHETFLGDSDSSVTVKDSTGRVIGTAMMGAVCIGAKISPDGSKIVYLYQTADPEMEDIVGSDLVIKNWDGTQRFQIETPDVMEMYPVWSPDGRMIACETYNADKIYVFRLK